LLNIFTNILRFQGENTCVWCVYSNSSLRRIRRIITNNRRRFDEQQQHPAADLKCWTLLAQQAQNPSGILGTRSRKSSYSISWGTELVAQNATDFGNNPDNSV
jgi:DNA-binding FadR family transcriptional regulator